MTPPAGSKSVAELAGSSSWPSVLHRQGRHDRQGCAQGQGGRCRRYRGIQPRRPRLDQCPATAEVLPEIAAALKGTGVKVLVDGGIRTGVDVFKALALGADGVLICRPFVTAVYGGGAEGVKCYIDKLAGELADTMQMCGAHSIEEITPDMVRV